MCAAYIVCTVMPRTDDYLSIRWWCSCTLIIFIYIYVLRIEAATTRRWRTGCTSRFRARTRVFRVHAAPSSRSLLHLVSVRPANTRVLKKKKEIIIYYNIAALFNIIIVVNTYCGYLLRCMIL